MIYSDHLVSYYELSTKEDKSVSCKKDLLYDYYIRFYLKNIVFFLNNNWII